MASILYILSATTLSDPLMYSISVVNSEMKGSCRSWKQVEVSHGSFEKRPLKVYDQ